MKVFRSLLSSLFILACLPSLAAQAQTGAGEAPRAGMRSMVVSPPPAKAQAAPPEAAKPPEAQPTSAPVRKPLDLKDSLRKPEDLKPWGELPSLSLLTTKEQTDRMVRIVESDPGIVPPQGLMLLSKALVDQKRMEEAALYLYVAQLRLLFDTQRWPARPDPADVTRIRQEQSKTQDQSGHATGPKTPRFIDPHSAVTALGTMMSASISRWMVEDATRAEAVMAKVKSWDESVPYAYLPGYDVPPATPFDTWGKTLTAVRTDYFSRMNAFIAGLKKVQTRR